MPQHCNAFFDAKGDQPWNVLPSTSGRLPHKFVFATKWQAVSLSQARRRIVTALATERSDLTTFAGNWRRLRMSSKARHGLSASS